MRAALIGAIVIVWGGAAAAAEWATIVPGESTTESVKAEFGEPSRATKTKIDTYDSIDWTYEGSRAPAGMIRMVVQFGILKKGGYRPNVVRTFRLEPKPGVEPTVSYLSEVLATIQQQPVKIVIRAAYQSDRASQWIAERAKITPVVLPFTVGGDPEAKDLFGLFDDTLARLLKAIG